MTITRRCSSASVVVVAVFVLLPVVMINIVLCMSVASRQAYLCVRADFRIARPGQRWARLLQEDQLHQPLHQPPHISAPLRPSGPAPVQRGSLPGEVGQQVTRCSLSHRITALIVSWQILAFVGCWKARATLLQIDTVCVWISLPSKGNPFPQRSTKQTSQLIIHSSILCHNFSFSVPSFFIPAALINGLDSYHDFLVTRHVVLCDKCELFTHRTTQKIRISCKSSCKSNST